jgi:hypothetical protein
VFQACVRGATRRSTLLGTKNARDGGDPLQALGRVARVIANETPSAILVRYIRHPSRFHWLNDHANRSVSTTAEL